MSLDLLHYIANVVMQLFVVRAYCLMLTMRSNVLFALLTIVGVGLGFVLQGMGLPGHIRFFIVTLPFSIVLPVAMSRGQISHRITWTAMIMAMITATDVIGSLVFAAFTGSPYEHSVTQANATYVIATYALLIPLVALFLEAIIALHDRIDRSGNAGLRLPVIALFFWSSLLQGLIEQKWLDYHATSGWPTPTIALYSEVLSLLIILGAFAVARQDDLARHKLAEAAAARQQYEYLQSEVETMTSRSREMRQLRHDLANHMEVALELAAQGRVEEADRHLAILQEHAWMLSGTGGPRA